MSTRAQDRYDDVDTPVAHQHCPVEDRSLLHITHVPHQVPVHPAAWHHVGVEVQESIREIPNVLTGETKRRNTIG